MTKRRKNLTSMFLALALVSVLVMVSCAPVAPVEKEKLIPVGLSVFLTGPVASTGTGYAEGLMDYLRYVNDELGGIEYRTAEGKTEKARLKIMWEDSGYSVAKGISIYKRQKAAGTVLTIQCSTSETEALAPTMSRDRMPNITLSASPIIMAVEPRYSTAAWVHYSDQFGGMFNWVVSQWQGGRPPRIGIMAGDVPMSRVVQREVTAEKVAELGAELVSWEWLPMAPIDSTIELTRLRAARPDYVFFFHVPAAALVVMRDATRLHMEKEVTWVFHQIVADKLTLVLLGDMAEGVYFQNVTAWPAEDISGVKLGHSIIQKYRDHDATPFNIQTLFVSMAAVEGLRIALESVGLDGLTGEVINDAMHSVKDFDTGGIVPPITVDPNYPVLNRYMKMGVARDGRFVPVGDWLECPEIAIRPE